MKKVLIVLLSIVFIVSFNLPLFSQTVEQVQKAGKEIEKEKELREKIEKAPAKAEVEQPAAPAPVAPSAAEGKVLVKTITITGVTLLSAKVINDIIKSYKGKELTVREMQKVADLITDAYRQKGFITSRAYLPPQKIEQGTLEIRVVEGITGNIDIKGNRYFKTRLYTEKILLKKGESFDYEKLRKGLSKINQLPDRNVKAVLAPGKEPATTDVMLEAKDRLPIHIGLDWDNYGSRYVDRQRARTTLTHNNLLGFDDVLNFQYQLARGENYRLLALRYLFPLNEGLKLGFFAASSKIDLGDINARGKSRLYSLYATQSLIDRENVALTFNAGFDYKDTFNFQSGNETSRDRMRVVKGSLDLDLTDALGRTLIGNEVSYGIPDIMGGLEKVDDRSSRPGAGGKFVKDNLYLLRLQKLPFNATLLWKNQAQFSPYILTATEQFQIGGIVNVRGYPLAEAVGDRGSSMTWELSMPPYLFPKDIKVPFSKAKFYDAVRIVTFYDWGNVRLKRPTGTEEKNKTLRGAGCGLRFNLPEDFSFRVEVAWPLDNTPSDGNHARTWAEVSKTF
jgi:hemolysin activation/secretion protein